MQQKPVFNSHHSKRRQLLHPSYCPPPVPVSFSGRHSTNCSSYSVRCALNYCMHAGVRHPGDGNWSLQSRPTAMASPHQSVPRRQPKQPPHCPPPPSHHPPPPTHHPPPPTHHPPPPFPPSHPPAGRSSVKGKSSCCSTLNTLYIHLII